MGVVNVYKKDSVRQILDDVYEEVNWTYLAKNHFGKSRSLLYHKFAGKNNDVADDFSDIDREKLKHALKDTAIRINTAADRL